MIKMPKFRERLRHMTLAMLCVAWLQATGAPVFAETKIHESGLATGDGLEAVLNHCTVCHAASLIVENHMTREQWEQTLTWMRVQQGMWDLPPDDQAKILNYLATYQGPVSSGQAPGNHKMYEYEYRPNPLYN